MEVGRRYLLNYMHETENARSIARPGMDICTTSPVASRAREDTHEVVCSVRPLSRGWITAKFVDNKSLVCVAKSGHRTWEKNHSLVLVLPSSDWAPCRDRSFTDTIPGACAHAKSKHDRS
jgi:hypothetical protein